MTGAITFGFGMGAFVFGIVSSMLINPRNLQMEKVGSNDIYGPEVANNSLIALRKISLCWAILTIVALFLIKIRTNEGE